ncbi:hypothetical protein ACVGVM_27280 [Pseudonocardia bannensis]|uniref:Uncharacterized protein n=1 Tax=Pseudonocardia bannensis TaxID=630973 RepID=A0A848DFP7_9PSEU|nr:hypothetical protein [Pseudonocardia bannensis]
MNRRGGKHRLARKTRNTLPLRYPQKKSQRKAGVLAATRALLAGTTGLLILTGTATGFNNGVVPMEMVTTSFINVE